MAKIGKIALDIPFKTASQGKVFIDKARALGCDEDEAAFDERLKKIAKASPLNIQKPKKAKRPPK